MVERDVLQRAFGEHGIILFNNVGLPLLALQKPETSSNISPCQQIKLVYPKNKLKLSAFGVTDVDRACTTV
jgi:hypothetical protein